MGVALIPAGAILLGVLLAQRNLHGRSPNGPPEAEPGTAAVLLWLVFLPLALASLAGVLDGHLELLPLLGLSVLLLFPWWVSRAVFIPLGMVRVAYWTLWASDGFFRLDRHGGAALAGAFALLRRPRHDPTLEAWLLGRMERQGPRLRGAGAAALGLLAASRGDLASARMLLAQVERFAPKVTPALALRLCRDWLATDLAARGEWSALAAQAPSWRRRLPGFLTAAARRMTGHAHAPSPYAMLLAWCWAGAPLGALALLRQAWTFGTATAPVPEEVGHSAPEVASGTLEEALARHAALLQAPPEGVTSEVVARVARAWDAALGLGAVRERCLRRALVLRTPGGEALGQVRAEASASLAALCRDGAVSLPALEGHGPTAEGIAKVLREALLTELELAAEALQARVDAGRALPRTDEWQDFARFVARYDAAVAVGGEALRRVAYGQVHRAVCNLAVWLFNDRKEWAVGHVLFQWLRAEAERLGDTRLLELHTKNSACGT